MFSKVFSNRRAQAAAAAVLVAVIATVIISYVILISPAERAEILDEDLSFGSGSSSGSSVAAAEILKEFPGTIDYLNLREIEHGLASVRIYTSSEVDQVAQRDSLFVENALFSEQPALMQFRVPSADRADDVVLNFRVADAQGVLHVDFNGEEVYRSAVIAGETPVITLSQSLLQDRNSLKFSVSSPGARFWQRNAIELEDLKVVAQVTDVSSQASSHTFLVSDTEYDNLEAVEIQFRPECNYDTVGPLDVLVNGQEVYSAIPDCELDLVPIEFSASRIVPGENEVTFRTDRGLYLLSRVKVLSELEQVEYPVYFFPLSLEETNAVEDGRRDVVLRLQFTDDTSLKQGFVQINGRNMHFDTRDDSETFVLNDEIVASNNALRIVPQKTIHVREFTIDLE